jgi:NAD(P) transhydrogenase subunit alpha
VTAEAESAGIIALGLAAVVLATLNIVGGFAVTDRMLEMFKPKKAPKEAAKIEGGSK